MGRPYLIAQLEIRFPEGSSCTVVTDKSWKTHEGPLLRNNMYLGEEDDARREIPGWDTVDFEDSAWRQVAFAPDPRGRLEAQSQPPVRVAEEIRPDSTSEPLPGVFIVDFGENFAGWIRLRVKAPAGTRMERNLC